MTSSDRYRAMAERVLPGGAIGTRLNPDGLNMTIASAAGSRITDVDGTEWIDYVGGAGALILGHQHPAVVDAVQRQAARSLHQYAALSDVAVELAAALVDAVPGAERMVFTTTGSEATSYAIRMARAATGRTKILKFEGAFHGNHDYAGIGVSPAGPSAYPAGTAFTDGTPKAVVDTMLIAPYNDLERLRQITDEHGHDVAGIIVEPVQRIISPQPGFLEGLRALADELGAVLIFDEVVTGFRLAYGGAQEYFGVQADLATFGKIVGGGGPGGAVIGSADLVDQSHPNRKGTGGYVYASGTLHGNPIGAAAGLATLALLREPGFYDALAARTCALTHAIATELGKHGQGAIVEHVGSMWQILHTTRSPQQYTDLLDANPAATVAFDIELMRRRINVVPGLRRFVSSAHTDEDFTKTVAAVADACHALEEQDDH
ncbi:MAG: aminotransferase class III-fold pyridoxal phosphate-dependent enzyme [Acidimicrobiia bacterium]|nr:aminotransferase class III-fold pyridoxal phosphate-dependent enzyme [Acidimicrobiia bacterium]